MEKVTLSARKQKVNKKSWNLYSYVNNNPVNYTDPEGLLEVHTEAGVPLNLELALKDLLAWESFQEMQILFMFQRNELTYYINARAREIGSITVYVPGNPPIEYVHVQAPPSRTPNIWMVGFSRISDKVQNWSKFKGQKINLNKITKTIIPNKYYPSRYLNIPQESPGNMIPIVPKSSHLSISDKILVAIAQLLSTFAKTEFFLITPAVLPQQWQNYNLPEECQGCI